MKAFIKRLPDHCDSFDQVLGTNNQMVVSDLKTEKGIIKRAEQYAKGKPYQIEIYYDNDKIYGTPNKTIRHY